MVSPRRKLNENRYTVFLFANLAIEYTKKRVELPIKGANIEPSLAMEQAKERATDLTTVGNNSVVYRYTIPQQTYNKTTIIKFKAIFWRMNNEIKFKIGCFPPYIPSGPRQVFLKTH